MGDAISAFTDISDVRPVGFHFCLGKAKKRRALPSTKDIKTSLYVVALKPVWPYS
jgi:hypothetical protein